jgi:putative inorganic carbon (hco3(-)) transporter
MPPLTAVRSANCRGFQITSRFGPDSGRREGSYTGLMRTLERPESPRISLAPLLGLLGILALAYAVAVLSPSYGLVAILGVLLLGAILRWPLLGLCLLIPSVPFQSLRSFNLGPFPASSTELLVGVTLVAWLLQVIMGRRHTLAPLPLLPPLLLFLTGITLSFLSIVSAPPDQGSLVWGFKELVKWVELLVVYVLAGNLLTSRRQLRLAAVLIVASTAVEALVGLYQFVRKVGPPSFLIQGHFMRAYGSFAQPNPFGGYLNMGVLLAVALAAVYARRLGGRWLLLASAVIVCAIVCSLSRSAWLALAVAAVLLLDRGGSRSRTLVGFGLAGAIIIAWLFAIHLVPGSLSTRVVAAFDIYNVDVLHPTPATFSAAQRLAFWIAGENMFTSHWLLGIGMGNFGIVYPHYAVPGWNVGLDHAHDYYLNQAVETGLVGLGTYLVFLFSAFRLLWRPSARLRDPLFHAIVAGTLGMLITLSVHNLLDDLYVHGTVVQIALMLAMAGVAIRLDRAVPPSVDRVEVRAGLGDRQPAEPVVIP